MCLDVRLQRSSFPGDFVFGREAKVIPFSRRLRVWTWDSTDLFFQAIMWLEVRRHWPLFRTIMWLDIRQQRSPFPGDYVFGHETTLITFSRWLCVWTWDNTDRLFQAIMCLDVRQQWSFSIRLCVWTWGNTDLLFHAIMCFDMRQQLSPFQGDYVFWRWTTVISFSKRLFVLTWDNSDFLFQASMCGFCVSNGVLIDKIERLHDVMSIFDFRGMLWV